jgi:hypothetical protein
MTDRYIALDYAARHANRWLDSLATRPVPARAAVADVVELLGTELPAGPTPASEVIDLLASACDPGLTAEVTRRLMADGTAWMTGSRWHDRAVLRISVSNWSTTDDDVARSLTALGRAATED